MDQESNQMEQHPVLCRNGCGFYSNAGTEGLCSVCYKDMIKKKQQPPSGMPASLAPNPGSSGSASMATLSIDETSSSSMSSAATSPLKSNSTSALNTASPTVILPSLGEKKECSDSNLAACSSRLDMDDSSNDFVASPSTSSMDSFSDKEQKEGKKKKNRCLSCKKKVGLTGFTCRCGGLFCSIHRYSDKHDCNFNYKELGAEEIRKSNPVVVAKKVQKI